jgi:hypothetical protein
MPGRAAFKIGLAAARKVGHAAVKAKRNSADAAHDEVRVVEASQPQSDFRIQARKRLIRQVGKGFDEDALMAKMQQCEAGREHVARQQPRSGHPHQPVRAHVVPGNRALDQKGFRLAAFDMRPNAFAGQGQAVAVARSLQQTHAHLRLQ